jgi:ribosome-associated protein
VSTAVRLIFDVQNCPALPSSIRERLIAQTINRQNSAGEIYIEAKRYRTQAGNRQDAEERLAELIRKAMIVPKKRRPTKPTKASVKRRIDGKKKRGAVKKLRNIKPSRED